MVVWDANDFQFLLQRPLVSEKSLVIQVDATYLVETIDYDLPMSTCACVMPLLKVVTLGFWGQKSQDLPTVALAHIIIGTYEEFPS
jgi:hypothetical protein